MSSCAMDIGTLAILNTNKVQLDGIKDAAGVYDVGGTFTFTLKDEDDVNVTGAVNVAMPYIAGTDATYRGVIPSTVSLTEFDYYKIVIDGTDSSGGVFHQEVVLPAQER